MNVEYAPCAVTNIIYFKYKIKFLNIDLPKDILKDLDFLYIFFLLRLKLLLFMVLDINNYIGNEDLNFIIYEYNEYSKTYNIKINDILFDSFN
jgi:hypothetical protein